MEKALRSSSACCCGMSCRTGFNVLFVLSLLYNGFWASVHFRIQFAQLDWLWLVFDILGILINLFGIFAVTKGNRAYFMGLRILVILELVRDITLLVMDIISVYNMNGFTQLIPGIHYAMLLFLLLPIVLQTCIIWLIQQAVATLNEMEVNSNESQSENSNESENRNPWPQRPPRIYFV